MGAAKNVALEPLTSALGVAAFLHNVIIVHPIISLVAECFFMHYNATLCNIALGKVFVALQHLSIGAINFWHTKTF